ncbi:type II secretion system minor pseudopilin GspI [Pseudaquabacterium rugosum]|uniref:Type II secretion system protein I n=1 Tax=Pseudaquabacterium rugosum TaxID=2984194 RepID=A0ABU9B485_9BURK
MPVPSAHPARRRPLAAPRPPGPGRGFTLVEVLVALAITALCLGAGLRAAGALTDNASRLQAVMLAQWCADNQLTGLRLSRQFPGTSESEFSCEQLGRRYSGKLSAQTHPLQANFSTVDATVFDEDGRQLLRLSTIVGRN